MGGFEFPSRGVKLNSWRRLFKSHFNKKLKFPSTLSPLIFLSCLMLVAIPLLHVGLHVSLWTSLWSQVHSSVFVFSTSVRLPSHSGFYGHRQSRFLFMCERVFSRNVGGGFRAYFQFLQKAFSQSGKRGQTEGDASEKERWERKEGRWENGEHRREWWKWRRSLKKLLLKSQKKRRIGGGEGGGSGWQQRRKELREGEKEKEWETETKTDRKLMSSAPVWDGWEEGSKGEGEAEGRGGRTVQNTLI